MTIPKYEMDLLKKEIKAMNIKKPTKKLINSIKIKGYRLTKKEKEELAFDIVNFKLDANDENAMIKALLTNRKLNKEIEEENKKWEKEKTSFVKEWKRLKIKYNCFDERDKNISLKELIKRWDSDNYYEVGFMWEYRDCIEYYGGKKYAQYYCATRGICPDSEVEIWK